MKNVKELRDAISKEATRHLYGYWAGLRETTDSHVKYILPALCRILRITETDLVDIVNNPGQSFNKKARTSTEMNADEKLVEMQALALEIAVDILMEYTPKEKKTILCWAWSALEMIHYKDYKK